MPRKGYKPTEEHKLNLKLNHKGFNGFHHTQKNKEIQRKRALEQFKNGISEETRKKLKIARIGKKPFLGKKHKDKTKELISKSQLGVKKTEESNRKNSESHKGNKCYLWIDGRTPENIRIRGGIEFRLWRESVFSRDGWTCQKCLKRGGILHPHHIQNFSQYPELRFAIDNGITFCKQHHILFHKIYGKKNNNQEQINEFISIN